jgi:hypothetical protein
VEHLADDGVDGLVGEERRGVVLDHRDAIGDAVAREQLARGRGDVGDPLDADDLAGLLRGEVAHDASAAAELEGDSAGRDEPRNSLAKGADAGLGREHLTVVVERNVLPEERVGVDLGPGLAFSDDAEARAEDARGEGRLRDMGIDCVHRLFSSSDRLVQPLTSRP